MKKIIIILLLLISNVESGYSQPYESIFASTGNTEWVFTWGNLWGRTNDTVYVEKDTLVNGLNYKKIVTRKGYYDGGLLRENTDSGKVWYRDIQCVDANDTLEKLVFDFSLKVGDTFKTMLHNLYSYTNHGEIVDSIDEIGGLKYIYFKATDNGFGDEPITFIEGIGSNLGVILKACSGSYMRSRYLLCSYKNGQKTTYENKFYNGVCWMFNDITEDINANSKVRIKLYPQPVSALLNVEVQGDFYVNRLEIINQIGQIVYKVSDNSIHQIDVSAIPSGYYFLRISADKGHVITKPLIISK